ncbi:nudix-type nucleoside diphosphatase (YffH/AdpP family) [Pedobacter sp. AK013]|uniref:GDP-mannose pyrophosphatase NudK n=1 Tax=Pedobacter sp. AK013 TaxID=2723071 RepID=UPI00160DE5E4|nr:GDP-mannose pyrophosphatase NudK [Pedobacter sp. AK013]MBB6237230.1 nudix-type nucleoside diphosphatase (YffH/AdpP family) [Pedobacter sp. AK013]
MKNINILNTQILSDNWYILKKVSFEMTAIDGSKTILEREAYDRGNGATILLYNKERKTVVLTRQFRIPTFINGNDTGYLIECCAGLLDEDNAEDCIRRETEEETGFKIDHVEKIFEAYMSPGSVTELLYFFVAAYSHDMKLHDGGGVQEENEDIEVLELPFEKTLEMVRSGEIKDGKTIMLLQYAQLKGLML